MNDNINSALQEEFEVLLGRYYWDDLDVIERGRLLELLETHESFRADFNQFGSLDRFLTEPDVTALPGSGGNGSSSGASSVADPASSRILPFFRKISGSYSMRRGGLAAAATLLIAFGALYLLRMQFGSDGMEHDRIVLTRGRCLVNGKIPGANTPLAGKTIRSGRNSVCDLRFQKGYTVRIRLFPESEITSVRSGDRLIVALRRGDILVESSRVKPGEELRVLAPGNLIRFLGTRVYLRQQSAGATQIEVMTGKIEVRSGNLYHMPRLVLNTSERERRRLTETAPDLFRERTRIVGRGEFLIVAEDLNLGEKKRTTLRNLESEIVRRQSVPEVRQSSLQPTMKNWLKRLTPSARKALDQKKTRFLTGKLGAVRQKQLSGELSDVPAQPAKDTNGRRMKNGKASGRQLLQSARKVRESGLQLIYLRNGTLFRGRIYQEGDEYIVQSENGSRRFRPREIEKIVQE